jgi:hypothetical protein
LPEAALRLEVAPDHDAVVRLERLRHPVDERSREAERIAHLAYGRPRPVRDEVADHPRVLGAVRAVHVLDHLFAPGGREVDVHVRIGGPTIVDEPLEQEVVADGIDTRDAEHVGEDRISSAPPPLGRDAPLAGEAHEVPADEEELGETGPFDDVELVGELVHHRRRHRVITPSGARPAQVREMAERCLALGDGEARKAVALEAELHRTRRRELTRRAQPLRPGSSGPQVGGRGVARREGPELRLRLQVRLTRRIPQVGEGRQRSTVPDRGHDVVELGRPGWARMASDDVMELPILRRACRTSYSTTTGGELAAVAADLPRAVVIAGGDRSSTKKAAATPNAPAGPRSSTAEQPAVPLGGETGPVPIARPEPPGDLAVTAAGQGDDPLGVLGEECLAEPRHALRPGHVRP